MNTAQIKEMDAAYVLPTYGRYPLVVARAQGTRLWDTDGKRYLDFLAGIAVTPLGHCHPAVVEAIVRQASTVIHTSNLFYTEPGTRLAALLHEAGALDKVFFANSGAEANEGAFKLARKYQWRKGDRQKTRIVSMAHSFHGRTLATLAATAKPELQEGFGPMPADFGPYVELNNADALKGAVDDTVAAVIIEPVQGEGGLDVATPEFLQAARAICDAHGALLIFDEIQCGLGRTGTFFAWQHSGVKPDILTMAKGLGGGLPIGCFAATEAVASGFRPGDHGSTFGANPVSCAAACAVLTTMQAEGLVARAGALGDYLAGKLQELVVRHPGKALRVRGKGLMIGLEVAGEGKPLLDACRSLGLVANVTAGNVLRMLPPYTITEAEIDEATGIIDQALSQLS